MKVTLWEAAEERSPGRQDALDAARDASLAQARYHRVGGRAGPGLGGGAGSQSGGGESAWAAGRRSMDEAANEMELK